MDFQNLTHKFSWPDQFLWWVKTLLIILPILVWAADTRYELKHSAEYAVLKNDLEKLQIKKEHDNLDQWEQALLVRLKNRVKTLERKGVGEK